MKILYLTDQTYLHGGIEKVLSRKANYLADAAGYEVVICTYNQQGNKPVYPFGKTIRFVDLGVNYEIGKSYFSSVNLRKIPRHISRLNEVLTKEKPETVISSSFGPDFYFLPFVRRSIPKVKEFHSSRFITSQQTTTLKKKLFKKLMSFIERHYDCLVVLNSDELKFYSSNVMVIPNPTENAEVIADLANKRILAAGRISPVKNFADLIKAFSRMSAQFPDWELHFWGEDYLDTQNRLKVQIESLGLGNQIHFMGVTDNLQAVMINYSIYAMTSETECFPMVLLESLAAGLPVITWDSPTGPRHIITDDEDGFITPYKNLDIFTQKLEMLMRDENRRLQMGANGRVNVQRFSIEKVMEQWRELFKLFIHENRKF